METNLLILKQMENIQKSVLDIKLITMRVLNFLIVLSIIVYNLTQIEIKKNKMINNQKNKSK